MPRRIQLAQLELVDADTARASAAVEAFDELDDDPDIGICCHTYLGDRSTWRLVDEHIFGVYDHELVATSSAGGQLWWPHTGGGDLLRALHARDPRALTEL